MVVANLEVITLTVVVVRRATEAILVLETKQEVLDDLMMMTICMVVQADLAVLVLIPEADLAVLALVLALDVLEMTI